MAFNFTGKNVKREIESFQTLNNEEKKIKSKELSAQEVEIIVHLEELYDKKSPTNSFIFCLT